MPAKPNPYARIAKLAADLVKWYGLEPDAVLTWQVFGDRGADTDGVPVVVNDAKGKAVAQTFAATAADVAELAARHCHEAAYPNVYLTFGLHDPPSKRQQGTCRRVLAVALDCDACDWLAANRPAEFADNAEAKAYLHALPDAKLAELLAEHQAAAVATLANAGLPKPSSWWRSGYGCYALYALRGDDDGATDVDLCRAINRDLVSAVNGAAGYALADRSATDAGSRVLRAPGAFNVKRPDRPLACTVLDGRGPMYTATALRAAVPAPEPRQTAPEPRGDSPRPVDPEGRMSPQETALAALPFIPADDYGVWVGVGQALHALGLAVADWDRWSQSSADKYQPGACDEKWHTFDRSDKPEVASGWLVNKAREVEPDFMRAGWRAKQRGESPAPRQRKAAAPGQDAPPAAQDAPEAADRLEAEAFDPAAASARLAAFVATVKAAPEEDRPDLLIDALADAELLDTISAFDPRASEVASFVLMLKRNMPRGYNGYVDALTKAARVVAEEEQEEPPEAKQSTKLLRLAEEAEVEAFRHAGDGTLWLAVPEGNHHRAYPLGEHGGGVTLWLTRLYADAHGGSAPSSVAVAEAGRRLAADADRPEAPEHDVHLRIAEHDGRIYFDLGRPDWHVAEVDAEGWRVVPCPRGLYFRRGRDTAPLPNPSRRGDWKPLVKLLKGWLDPSDLVMTVAWLVAAMRPGYPYHALAIYGEQGSGKSTLARLLRYLVDPAGPDGIGIIGAPKDEEAITAHAIGHHVCAFDNLSHLPGDIADCLCRLATGTGVSRRQKYTDFGEALVYVKRPIIVNGIAEVTTRADLLSRFVLVTTRPLAERRTEADLWREAEKARPAVLGAMLTAASAALRHRADVTGPLPRMADAGEWLLAAEHGGALPWKKVGTLAGIMADNQASAQSTAAEASPLTKYLVALAEANSGEAWRPTAAELLDDLRDLARDTKDLARKEWPADATRLAAALTRLAPALRESGIVDVQRRKTEGRKWWSITLTGSGAASDPDSDPGDPFSDPVLPLATPPATPPNQADSAALRQSGAAGAAEPPLLLTQQVGEIEGLGSKDVCGEGYVAEWGSDSGPSDPGDPFASEEPPAPAGDPDDEGGEW